MVFAGDPLYTIDSSEAVAAVEAAQKTVENYEKQLQTIYDAANYLTVTADYSGTLLDAADIGIETPSVWGRRLQRLSTTAR